MQFSRPLGVPSMIVIELPFRPNNPYFLLPNKRGEGMAQSIERATSGQEAEGPIPGRPLSSG